MSTFHLGRTLTGDLSLERYPYRMCFIILIGHSVTLEKFYKRFSRNSRAAAWKNFSYQYTIKKVIYDEKRFVKAQIRRFMIVKFSRKRNCFDDDVDNVIGWSVCGIYPKSIEVFFAAAFPKRSCKKHEYTRSNCLW